jgi:hypothetical protein
MITVEQIVNTQKTNIDTFFGLSGKAFEGIEKLVELNLSAAKAAMAEAAQNHQARAVRQGPARAGRPADEPAPAGRREGCRLRPLRVRDRRLDRRRSLARREAQAAEAQAKFMAIVDTAVKNAPAGTENGVALIKSAVAAANNAIETAQKAAKQAAEVAEANFNAMSSTAVRATKGKKA